MTKNEQREMLNGLMAEYAGPITQCPTFQPRRSLAWTPAEIWAFKVMQGKSVKEKMLESGEGK